MKNKNNPYFSKKLGYFLDKSTAYKAEIVKELFFRKELSAADISLITNKSLPLISKVLNDLIQEGWIVENGYAASTGGRRPQVFSLVNNKLYVVAVAVDQHFTQVALVGMNGKIAGSVETLELDLKDNAAALDSLTNFIQQFISETGVAVAHIAGIGIGMPGFVDATRGVNYSYFKITSGTLTDYLHEKTGLPVYIDNDSSVMALAELRMGAARNAESAMVINLSWGIGLGMIINKKLFRGDNGFAGEFSHIPLFQNNKICDCGKTGCLETEASLYIMAEKAMHHTDADKPTMLKELSLKHLQDTTYKILSAAVRGDKFAVELLSDIAYNIGRGVAVLIHIINPEQIILTGRGAIAGKLWLAPMQQAINVHCIPRLAENATVEISALGDEAGLLGAAALVMENLNKDFFMHQASKNAATVVV